LLILADKVPEKIRKRLKERPEAFRQLADLDDCTLDEVLANLASNQPKKPQRK
jgi:HTH-type transcriptional regulator, competence development regulator